MTTTEIVNLRKELHRNPELSGNEPETAKRIREFVKVSEPTSILGNVGGHGLAVIYEFAKAGPRVAIRCELDALPIEELNQFAHRSAKNGVSHKCGHDGHMAIVAGLAPWLKNQAFKIGSVILLFQPAEETGKGAEQVLKDSRIKNLNIDYIFALHNIPGQAKHAIITMSEGFSAEVQSFCIKLKGKESHAAEPELGINPASAIAKLIDECNKLNLSDPHDDEFAILTPVHANLGQKSYGISPGFAELHYTIRTWSTEKMDILKSNLEDAFGAVCKSEKLDYEVNWFEYFPACKNDSQCSELVKEAAKEKNLRVINRPYPFKFGEDFGWYTKHYKTAMFGLGAGADTPALHNASYDFPDDIIETGIEIFKSIITKTLKVD